MFETIARRIANEDSSSTHIGRRGFLRGAVTSAAAVFVASKSASFLTMDAQAALNPCQICIQNNGSGCSSRTEVTDYCDDYGNGYKCCGCGNSWQICDIVCVPWPVGCYREKEGE